MNPPTHEEVAQRAHELWEEYGQPSGRDVEIWMEAEKRISLESAEAESKGAGSASPTLSESQSEGALAEAAAQQKQAARAPILPTKSAPRNAPPQTGKPLWNKPHSS